MYMNPYTIGFYNPIVSMYMYVHVLNEYIYSYCTIHVQYIQVYYSSKYI